MYFKSLPVVTLNIDKLSIAGNGNYAHDEAEDMFALGSGPIRLVIMFISNSSIERAKCRRSPHVDHELSWFRSGDEWLASAEKMEKAIVASKDGA